jgi:hypothetical protein
MTIYHKHHIIPKHMGGTNEPSNIIEVTVEEHANLHKNLWETHNHWEDYVAWKGLSGQITQDEARRLRVSLMNKQKIEDGTHHLLDGNIQRNAALNRIKNGTHNDKDFHIQVSCPHCGKTGNKFIMKRWHFDKCRDLLSI